MKGYIIRFGESARIFYTQYHAEQFARALSLNGTGYVMETIVIGRKAGVR